MKTANSPMPLILSAMEMEARAIAKALKQAALGDNVTVIGISACRLRDDFAKIKPPFILMAGLAGALDPMLRISDLVVDDPAGLAPNLPFLRRGIHTVNEVITSAADKTALFSQTGAAAVDMENAIVRAAAEKAGIPFIGLRSISDQADFAINPKFLTLIDEVGRPRPLATARILMGNISLIGELKQLQRQADQALATLASGVVEILRAVNAPH